MLFNWHFPALREFQIETKIMLKFAVRLFLSYNFLLQLKLVNPSVSRIEHLVTQMKWRLKEGGGEAIYEIGVEDNGRLTGLTKEELESSLKTIDTLVKR